MSILKRLTVGFALSSLSALLVLGCSWDYLIWQKSKKSDTPLFRFVLNERDGMGYIDRDGKVVIKPTLSPFNNSSDDDFFDGLAKVQTKDENWYIDATGKQVFRAGFSNPFSEGLASVRRNGKPGFVDRQGRSVTSPDFESAGDFAEGLAVVGLGQTFGYIDKSGSVVIKPAFVLAMPFSDGAARVIVQGDCLYVGYGPCAAFTPAILSDQPHEKRPSTGPKCRYSFIDRTGKTLFQNRYLDAKDFSEGLAPVGNGKLWGYVDKRGYLVIPFRYQDAEPFAEGLARVRVGERWAYIDRRGQTIIPARYTGALDFSEGLAVVGGRANVYWFIDNKGRQAIPHIYTAASNFVMGRAHVRTGVTWDSFQWSYIDRTGRAVFTYSSRPRPQ